MALTPAELNQKLADFNAMPRMEQIDRKRSFFEHLTGLDLKDDLDRNGVTTNEEKLTMLGFFDNIPDESMKFLISAYDKAGVDITNPNRAALRTDVGQKFSDPKFMRAVREDMVPHMEQMGNALGNWASSANIPPEEQERRDIVTTGFAMAFLNRLDEDKEAKDELNAFKNAFGLQGYSSVDQQLAAAGLDATTERDRTKIMLSKMLNVSKASFDVPGSEEEFLLQSFNGRSDRLIRAAEPFTPNGVSPLDVTRHEQVGAGSMTFIRARDIHSDMTAVKDTTAETYEVNPRAAAIFNRRVRALSLQENGMLLGIAGMTREKMGDAAFEEACDKLTLAPLHRYKELNGYSTFQEAIRGLIDHEKEFLGGKKAKSLLDEIIVGRDGKPVPGMVSALERMAKEEKKLSEKAKARQEKIDMKRKAKHEAPEIMEGLKAGDAIKGSFAALAKGVKNPEELFPALVEVFANFATGFIDHMSERQKKIRLFLKKAEYEAKEKAKASDKENDAARQADRVAREKLIIQNGGRSIYAPVAFDDYKKNIKEGHAFDMQNSTQHSPNRIVQGQPGQQPPVQAKGFKMRTSQLLRNLRGVNQSAATRVLGQEVKGKGLGDVFRAADEAKRAH